MKQPQPFSAEPGLHRFYWDLHVEPLKEVEPEYPMTAVFRKTAPELEPVGPSSGNVRKNGELSRGVKWAGQAESLG